jgi:hypothetical protein
LPFLRQAANKKANQCAYQPVEEKYIERAGRVKMKVYKREMQQRPKPTPNNPNATQSFIFTDLLNVDDILKPVYMQPLPKKNKATASGRYYVNEL